MTGVPYLGLGLSSNLEPGQPPDPYRLLDARPGLFDYVEYSAPLALSAARRRTGHFATLEARRDEVRPVFHPVQLNLWGPELESPEDLALLNEHALAVGSPWVSNDVAWWHTGGMMLPGCLYIAPPLTEAAADDCVRHALHVQRHLEVPLLLENPTLFSCHGPLHICDFMARLHQRSGLPLILDLGHLYSHQLSRGLPARDGIDRLPLDAIWEVHIAGGVVARHGERRFYLDDHPQPVHEVLLELLTDLLPRLPNLRAVTFEGDGHPELLAMRTLERLRGLVPRAAEPLPAPSPAAAPDGAPDPELPWRRFDELMGVTGLTGDTEADRADQDFRLAVLVDRIERRYPLTRLLVAGSREDLLAFTASEALCGPYRTGAARTVAHSFARWAAGQVDEAGATALDLERTVNALADAAPPSPPRSGHLGLAPNVRLGEFHHDLGEALHAAGALKRHLVGRALALGAVDSEGLAVLRDVVGRAPRRRWPIVVRNAGGRLEVIGLGNQLASALELARRHPHEAALPGHVSPTAIREGMRLGLIVRGRG